MMRLLIITHRIERGADLLDLLALHFLITHLQNHLDDLALIISGEPDRCADVGYREAAVVLLLQLLFCVVALARTPKQLVTLVCDNENAEREFVFSCVIVEGFRISLAGFCIRDRGLWSILLLWFCLAWLVIREPFNVHSLSTAPFLFLDQPLPSLIPRRPSVGIDVAKSAVLRAELSRLGEQRRIAKRLARKQVYKPSNENQ